jgi:CBS-domain-containing membrane protein
MKSELSLFTINLNSSVYDAAVKISHNSTRTLIIVNDNCMVVGVISEGDLLQSLINHDVPTISVTDVMNRAFQSCLESSYPKKKQIISWLRQGALLIPVCDSSGIIVDVIDVLTEVDQYLEI